MIIDEFYPPIKRSLPQFDFFIGTLHKEMFGYYASALLNNCLVLIRKDKNNQHEYGYAHQLNLIIDSFLGNHHNYKYYEIIEIDYATVIKFNFDQKDQIEQLYKKNISGLNYHIFIIVYKLNEHGKRILYAHSYHDLNMKLFLISILKWTRILPRYMKQEFSF
jgi:hypothetical protein